MLRANHDFGKGSIPRNILSLALPMTLAQIVNVMYNIVDRIYIGHIPGASSLALTGVGLVFPITTIVYGFSNLFGMGGVPLFSIARGEKDERKASQIMGNTFSLIVVAGVLITVLCLLFKEEILYAFGADELTFPYANEYITWYLFGTVFVMLTMGLNGFINAQGFAGIGMLTVIIGAVVNIVLDTLFIFVFDMGVKGAALATVIAQMSSSLWIILFLSGKRALIKLSVRDMKIRLRPTLKIISLGISGFVMSFTTCAVQVICNVMLKTLADTLYIGVMTVINSVREIMMMPINGLTNAAQPVMSYNYGAGLNKRVKKTIAFTSVITMLYGVLVWLVIQMFPAQLTRIFNSDPALVQAAIPSMRIYFFAFFAMSLQLSGQITFLALGRSKQAIFFSLLRKAIIVIPLTIWLPYVFGLGVNGVFLAEPISNVVGGAACFFTMLATVLPKLKKDAPETEQTA